MKHPKFSWKKYPADYNELSTGATMKTYEQMNKLEQMECRR